MWNWMWKRNGVALLVGLFTALLMVSACEKEAGEPGAEGATEEAAAVDEDSACAKAIHHMDSVAKTQGNPDRIKKAIELCEQKKSLEKHPELAECMMEKKSDKEMFNCPNAKVMLEWFPMEEPKIKAHCDYTAGAKTNAGQCHEYFVVMDHVTDNCAAVEGKWTEGQCPRDGAVAMCDRKERVEIYYSSEFTVEQAEEACGKGFPDGEFSTEL